MVQWCHYHHNSENDISYRMYVRYRLFWALHEGVRKAILDVKCFWWLIKNSKWQDEMCVDIKNMKSDQIVCPSYKVLLCCRGLNPQDRRWVSRWYDGVAAERAHLYSQAEKVQECDINPLRLNLLFQYPSPLWVSPLHGFSLHVRYIKFLIPQSDLIYNTFSAHSISSVPLLLLLLYFLFLSFFIVLNRISPYL